MTRTETLTYIARIGLVERIAASRLKDTYDHDTIKDFCQEVYLQLCEIPDEKWVKLQGDKKLENYVAKVVHHQCKPSGHSEARRHLRLNQRDEETELCEDYGCPRYQEGIDQ